MPVPLFGLRFVVLCASALLGLFLAACQEEPTEPSSIDPPGGPSFHATTTEDGRTRINFIAPADFQLVGDATAITTPVGQAIRLTRAATFLGGAAWLRTKQLLGAGFQAEFHFRISPSPCFPADGMAFVLHNDTRGTSVLGGLGGGMGYLGINRGLAVEFDTWDNNEFPDPNANHVAVMSNGAGPLSVSHTLTTTLGQANPPSPLANGLPHRAIIDYRPGSLDVFFDGAATPLIHTSTTLTSVFGANLLDADGKAWVGFTAATGGACEAHFIDILPNQPPVANAGGPYTVEEGNPVTLSANQSEDADGDPLTFAWDTDGDGQFDDGTGESIEATFGDNGLYTVRVRVTDHHNATNIDDAQVTVTNVAPTVGPVTVPLDPVQAGTPVTVSAAYTDPGTDDTHTGAVQWDIGGSFETDGVTANGGAVSATRTLPAGVYTVTLRVTDDDGASGTSTATAYIVVFDPNGGFVTGGGWIESPAGAYAADPTLSGKASFGFVAKYQSGASTPSGNTEFELRAGSLKFKSTSYEWLVVAGSKAKFKGEGTINGAGGYGFQLTALDGRLSGDGVDRFRIKISDLVTGGVVYDNKMGEDEDSDASTELGGGSIVIHKP